MQMILRLGLWKAYKFYHIVTKKASALLFHRSSDNQMKAHEDKCHVLLSTKEDLLANIAATQA